METETQRTDLWTWWGGGRKDMVGCMERVTWKHSLPYDPTIPLLGIYPEETKIEKDTCTAMFIAALFTVARTWKQPRCPLTDEWI